MPFRDSLIVSPRLVNKQSGEHQNPQPLEIWAMCMYRECIIEEQPPTAIFATYRFVRFCIFGLLFSTADHGVSESTQQAPPSFGGSAEALSVLICIFCSRSLAHSSAPFFLASCPCPRKRGLEGRGPGVGSPMICLFRFGYRTIITVVIALDNVVQDQGNTGTHTHSHTRPRFVPHAADQ